MPNHRELRWPKARVVSVAAKGRPGACQVRARKTNASEPLMMGRNKFRWRQNRRKFWLREQAQEERADGLGGVRPRGGVSLVQAALWNVGILSVDAKGDLQAEGLCKERSTEATEGCGAARSSEEARESGWSEGAASSGYECGATSDGRNLCP